MKFTKGDTVITYDGIIGIVIEDEPWSFLNDMIHVRYLIPTDTITWWIPIDSLKRIELTEEQKDKIMVEML